MKSQAQLGSYPRETRARDERISRSRLSLIAHKLLSLIVGIGLPCSTASAQQPLRSQSEGFMLGVGTESDGIVYDPSGSNPLHKSGSGGSLTLGYGLTPRWTIIARLSSATIDRGQSDHYSLGHLDLGARVHFRVGSNTVVPFLEAGYSLRGEGQEVRDSAGVTTIPLMATEYSSA